jgi:hypothetical protein
MSTPERRARLARCQLLAPAARAATPLEVVEAVVALHATDPATVFLSAAARQHQPSIEALEHALYDERSLVRMLGMRRTMFIVPWRRAPVVQAACTRAIAAQQRKLNHQLFSAAGLADDISGWLTALEDRTCAALAARGEATAQELSRDVPELKTQIERFADKSYGGPQGIATRILLVLSADGRIVRGRPRGSWTSTQYQWAPLEQWFGEPLADMDVDQARTELIGAWLHAFGPGTVADLKWWTGLPLGEVTHAVARLKTIEVGLEQGTGLLLAEDADALPTPEESWVALLPALDPTPMGYADRDWFLGSHGPVLFDRSGNIGPTVWVDGRIVGGWAQRANGAVAYKLLEDVGREASQAIAQQAHDLGQWLGARRIVPRFRTPLERELSA